MMVPSIVVLAGIKAGALPAKQTASSGVRAEGVTAGEAAEAEQSHGEHSWRHAALMRTFYLAAVRAAHRFSSQKGPLCEAPPLLLMNPPTNPLSASSPQIVEAVLPMREKLDACLIFPSMPAVMKLNKLGTFSMSQV